MNVLNHLHLQELTTCRSPLCVSLFLPTHSGGITWQQDANRLEQLVGQIQAAMLGGVGAVEAESVLRPAIELAAHKSFWKYSGDGLACFCAPNVMRAYHFPLQVDSQWRIDHYFHTLPLLPLLRSDGRLFLMALTERSARLYETTLTSMRQVELPGIKEAARVGRQCPQDPLPAEDSSSGGQSPAALVPLLSETLQYFQCVDQAVTQVLRSQRSPLVLACVGYLASLYRSVNSYARLITEKVPGNPHRWTADELRQHAWKLVEAHFQESRERAWERFERARAQGYGSQELGRVIQAAQEGRIETLFLARRENAWDDGEPHRIAVRAVDTPRQGRELLQNAAMLTLSNRGDVFLFDTLPNTDAPVAATIRSPTEESQKRRPTSYASD